MAQETTKVCFTITKTQPVYGRLWVESSSGPTKVKEGDELIGFIGIGGDGALLIEDYRTGEIWQVSRRHLWAAYCDARALPYGRMEDANAEV